jgi:hypothetical protein
MKKIIIKILLFVFIFVGVERFCHKKTHGFRIYKVQSELPFRPEWDIPYSDEEKRAVQKLLDQRFTFLSSGGQCYVFLSEDKTAVLKLFKQHHMRPQKWIHRVKLPAPLNEIRRKVFRDPEQRLESFFKSCLIAHLELKEETGLFFTHLNKTTYLKKQLLLIDPIGIAHVIDADRTEFLIQKKAAKIYPTIDELTASGRYDEAKECINSLMTLLSKRIAKGINDNDPIFKKNFGFIGTQAVEVDIGSFSKENPELYFPKLASQLDRFQSWIELKHPSLADHLKKSVNALTTEYPALKQTHAAPARRTWE